MANLIGVMDRLWFHQMILFSESTSLLLVTRNLNDHPQLNIKSLTYLSSSIASSNQSSSCFSLAATPDEETLSPPQQEEISTNSPLITRPLDDSDIEQREQHEDVSTKERPTRLNLVTSRVRSHSSSPSIQKHPKRHLRHPEPARRLQKSMSCRSLTQLELEEVKGFMDLGFKFNKEHLNPRLLRLVPGLQRLGLLNNHKDETEPIDKEKAERDKITEVEEVGEEDDERDFSRPYLSEAWLIKRPDSPLLSLRVPRVSAAADMKKHLRFWARTVASVIKQES